MADSESGLGSELKSGLFVIAAFVLAIGAGVGGFAILISVFGREFVKQNPTLVVALMMGVPTLLGCVVSLVPVPFFRSLGQLLAFVAWLAGIGTILIYSKLGAREVAVVWAWGAAITAIIYIPAEFWESWHTKAKDESLSIFSLIVTAFLFWPICAAVAFCVFSDAIFGIEPRGSDEAETEVTGP
jgi:hypothetical protein